METDSPMTSPQDNPAADVVERAEAHIQFELNLALEFSNYEQADRLQTVKDALKKLSGDVRSYEITFKRIEEEAARDRAEIERLRALPHLSVLPDAPRQEGGETLRAALLEELLDNGPVVTAPLSVDAPSWGRGLLSGWDLGVRAGFDALASPAPQGVREADPSDIRAAGWSVAVHNDYRQAGAPHTFWLFTKGNKAVKGEGRTDAEALAKIRSTLAEQGGA